MTVRELTTADPLHQYVAFASMVYDEIPARVPPDAEHMVAQLSGQALGGSHTGIQPFWVEDNERIPAVGRAAPPKSWGPAFAETSSSISETCESGRRGTAPPEFSI